MRRPVLWLALTLAVLDVARAAPGGITPPLRQSASSERVMRVGESVVLSFRWITKVAVGNPSVADVVVVSDNELLVNGRGAGATNLFVWDRQGRREFRVTVAGAGSLPGVGAAQVLPLVRATLIGTGLQVELVGDALLLSGQTPDVAAKGRIEAQVAAFNVPYRSLITVAAGEAAPRRTATEVVAVLNEAFKGSPVTARVLDAGTVILEGNVPEAAAEQARRVAKQLAPDVAVTDFFTAAGPQMRQVLVRTRVLEANKDRTRNLGIDWGTLSQGALSIGGPFVFGQKHVGGGVTQINPVGATVRALEEQKAVRVLSEPNLTVMEGNRGRVLIGGETPYPVLQGTVGGAGNAGSAVTVAYRPFGISLEVEVLGISEEGISMNVRSEVSMVDFSSAVKANGFDVPGLNTSRAETTVRIRPGESLGIGGLIQQSQRKKANKVPLLARIPLLGELFKSQSFQKGESELVIVVTPEILEPKRGSGDR